MVNVEMNTDLAVPKTSDEQKAAARNVLASQPDGDLLIQMLGL